MTLDTILHPRPELAVFAVTGRDRQSWLNALITQDLSKLAVGAGAYGLAVGKAGKILAELWFLGAMERTLVVLERSRLDRIREHFDKHLVMEDAEMSERLERGVLFVHGPHVSTVVDEARARGADATRIDWTGRGDGGVILAPEGELERLQAALAAHATLVTDQAWEALRIAWGIPRFGVDFDEETLPQEASLETVAVSFTKGCYLGQETVFMLEKRGHARRKLSRLLVEGDAPVAVGSEILLPDQGSVGLVTSATAGSAAEGSPALGYIKYKHATPGTALMIAGRNARVQR